MALAAQYQNVISEMITKAELVLDLREDLLLLRARWDQNAIAANIDDTTIAEVFPHLTEAELVNCLAAFEAVTTALGDYSTGQSINLLKMKG